MSLFRTIGIVLSLGLMLGLPLTGQVLAQSSPVAEDHLGVPGPIRFDGIDYHLAWSARPHAAYIK